MNEYDIFDIREELDEMERVILTEELCKEYGLDTSFWDYVRTWPIEEQKEMGYL